MHPMSAALTLHRTVVAALAHHPHKHAWSALGHNLGHSAALMTKGDTPMDYLAIASFLIGLWFVASFALRSRRRGD